MRCVIPLLFLCLLALPLQLRANPSLGEMLTTIELDLRARPESTAAGPEATERFIAGLVAASIEVFEQSRHLDAPYFARSAGPDGRPGLFNPDNIYGSALLSGAGRYRISGTGMALVVTVRRSAARYHDIQVGDPRFVTPNAVDHTASFSAAQAKIDDDGLLRFVISDADPGVANWLAPGNTREGFVFLRWQGLPAPLAAEDAPRIEAVSRSELRAHLPAGTPWLNATQRTLRRSVPLRS